MRWAEHPGKSHIKHTVTQKHRYLRLHKCSPRRVNNSSVKLSGAFPLGEPSLYIPRHSPRCRERLGESEIARCNSLPKVPRELADLRDQQLHSGGLCNGYPRQLVIMIRKPNSTAKVYLLVSSLFNPETQLHHVCSSSSPRNLCPSTHLFRAENRYQLLPCVPSAGHRHPGGPWRLSGQSWHPRPCSPRLHRRSCAHQADGAEDADPCGAGRAGKRGFSKLSLDGRNIDKQRRGDGGTIDREP
jgi:hypothetical protein